MQPLQRALRQREEAYFMPEHSPQGEMIRDKRVATFEDIRASLRKNSQALTSMDSSFRLELAYLEGPAEDALRASVKKKLLHALPSERRHRSMAQTATDIAYFKQQEIITTAPPGLVSLVNSVEEIILGMLKGSSPEASLIKSSDFFKDLLSRLPFFARRRGRSQFRGWQQEAHGSSPFFASVGRCTAEF